MISAETFRSVVSGQRRTLGARVLRSVLALGELPYSLAMRWRNRRYDRDASRVHRVAVPVLSVGNLTLGGTGKTPMVIWLARWFRREGVRVSIISRGYGKLRDGANDEARQLEDCLPDVPHLQNSDRVLAAKTAIEELATQLILLDDGFQHRRLGRDLDLVLIDATEPLGYDHVFPRGLLREPAVGLNRADVVAITRCNLISAESLSQLRERLRRLAPRAIHVEFAQTIVNLESASGHQLETSSLAGTPIVAFCGIGNPDAFRQTLEDLGAQVIDFRAFPDHHPYDASTMRRLTEWIASHSQAELAICTHKDLVKIRVDRVGPLPIYAAMLDLVLRAGDEDLRIRLQGLRNAVVDD